MSETAPATESNNVLVLVGLLVSGLVLGFGIRSLYWSFGREGDFASGEGCLQCDFRSVGFDGIDNISLLPAADYSIGLVVAGLLGMVILNATAWRRTGGY